LCLGSTASTHFIGEAEDNFSDQAKILIRTLCGNSASYVLDLSSGCLETFHPLFEFGSLLRPVLSHASRCGRAGHFGRLSFEHKKIGGKRIPLAAIGIDFNRILLSA
jgi:hypothetical protein